MNKIELRAMFNALREPHKGMIVQSAMGRSWMRCYRVF